MTYFLGCHKDHGPYMWESVMNGPYLCSKTKLFVFNQSDYSNILAKHDLTQDEKDMLRYDICAKEIYVLLLLQILSGWLVLSTLHNIFGIS